MCYLRKTVLNSFAVFTTRLSIEQTLRLQRREPCHLDAASPARNWHIVTLQAWKKTGILLRYRRDDVGSLEVGRCSFVNRGRILRRKPIVILNTNRKPYHWNNTTIFNPLAWPLTWDVDPIFGTICVALYLWNE